MLYPSSWNGSLTSLCPTNHPFSSPTFPPSSCTSSPFSLSPHKQTPTLSSTPQITLVGFSRGAYCVRLVATLINLIGVLAPSKMHRFPALFDALCHRGENAESKEHLQRLLEENEQDRQEYLEALDGRFPVKAVLVFDTVGIGGFFSSPRATGADQSLIKVPTRSKDDHDPPTPTVPIRFDAFGLPSEELGPHIEVALQALALDEGRKHYIPLLWRRDPSRIAEGQFLLQTYFSGCHTGDS